MSYFDSSKHPHGQGGKFAKTFNSDGTGVQARHLEAVRNYTQGGFGINSKLRAGTALSAGAGTDENDYGTASVSEQQMLHELDHLTQTARLKSPKTLYRVVGGKVLAGIQPGTVLNDAGFMSMSASASYVDEFAKDGNNQIKSPKFMMIRAPIGSRLADVSSHSIADQNEYESIAARNSSLVYVGKQGKYRVFDLVTPATGDDNPVEPSKSDASAPTPVATQRANTSTKNEKSKVSKYANPDMMHGLYDKKSYAGLVKGSDHIHVKNLLPEHAEYVRADLGNAKTVAEYVSNHSEGYKAAIQRLAHYKMKGVLHFGSESDVSSHDNLSEPNAFSHTLLNGLE